MLNYKRMSLFVFVVIGIAIPRAGAQTLGVGDPAPKLEVKSFVKGEPVTAFERGKTYVVEFWATWCGPCRTSIPHLTELQKKHPEVTFIGVSISEQDQDLVKPFVEKMGDKMAYRVALDLVDKDKNSHGVMSKSWMTAAGQGGIPTAFIVSGVGKIYWIGHPMQMDEPLEKIASGSWDLKTAVEEHRKETEKQAKIQKLENALDAAIKSGQPKDVVTSIDKILELRPDLESVHGPMKLTAYIKLGDEDKALGLARRLSAALSKSAQGLNGVAWAIVDPEAGIKPGSKLLQFAVETAQRADKLAEEKDPAIADTLGKAYFDSGDVPKAVETQERAVRLAKGTPFEQNKDITDRLEQYKKAAKK
ncbi:MAG: redoxin domain-containing protein [Isosphaerales bacterium]